MFDNNNYNKNSLLNGSTAWVVKLVKYRGIWESKADSGGLTNS